ncbi:gas vesicle protein [Candidatus Woesearchaeota archaeon]|nr:gas vesicle protein [Candidatus Woesearchaeota archaeon]
MRHNTNIGIVELIDRTLNKGVILNADLIVNVADVPLLAANLRLALASVETMLKYGVMNDWLTAVALVKEVVIYKSSPNNHEFYTQKGGFSSQLRICRKFLLKIRICRNFRARSKIPLCSCNLEFLTK